MIGSPVRRGLLVAVVAAAVAALLAGCGGAPEPPPVPAAAPAAPVAAAPAAPATSAVSTRRVAALTPSPPVGLTVPAIGVRTGALLDLGIDGTGALEVPPDAGSAGWFTLGPAPGAAGPAVIAAHVDYRGVPGVFSRLRDLEAGDEVNVRRADGGEALFTTYRVDHYPKSGFPTEKVYGDTGGAELRMITCGGEFDGDTGQYRDNVVAYARLTGVR